MFPKLFIGPMSKNIVDTAIELATQGWNLGFIPSRRQVDKRRGYVNDWNTKEFVSYVRERTDKIPIQRDHAGPGQGKEKDNGLTSLLEDGSNNLDLIHIDPWKVYPKMDDAVINTNIMIEYYCGKNETSLFEVGTEEAISKYSASELDTFLEKLKKFVDPKKFSRIKFAVIQSGVGLLGVKNTGTFSEQRCKDMISVCRNHNLLAKEHNGDYLDEKDIRRRFELGLDAINIAPELGVEETRCTLQKIEEEEREDLFERLFDACYLSRLWLKWLPDGFSPEDSHEKRLLVEVCGHYIFNTDEFRDITKELSGLQELIKLRLSNKIKTLHENCTVPDRDGRR
jgi:hypothetical protein|tara:strand:- start:464 stop:1483 length:1020 start_codon:yes stop_codon:yes gene_type:complete